MVAGSISTIGMGKYRDSRRSSSYVADNGLSGDGLVYCVIVRLASDLFIHGSLVGLAKTGFVLCFLHVGAGVLS